MNLRRCLTTLLLLLASPLWALHPKDFQNPEEEQRYRALAKELRCVMCQNQSLADSPAGVADDMRQQVLQQVRAGRSDAEIRDWFVARYGEFILYRPRIEPVTWALWCVACTFVSVSQPAVGAAFPTALAGRALSAFNLVIFGGVFCIQWGIGLAIDALRAAGLSEPAAFRAAFALFGVAGLLSYLWFLARPERPGAAAADNAPLAPDAAAPPDRP